MASFEDYDEFGNYIGADLDSDDEEMQQEPFAREAGLDIDTKDSLTEAAHEKHPSRAAAVLERVLRVEVAPGRPAGRRPGGPASR